MTSPTGPVVAIHAGAGERLPAVLEHEAEIRGALLDALAAGRAPLECGQDAGEAVQAAVVAMESFELFNAGRGSTLCADGSVEMSAALMRSDRAAGAVARVRHTEHPILGAAVVMHSAQVLMVGGAADALAAQAGLEQRAREYFVTERQSTRLLEAAAGTDHATVGAVCLAPNGGLAAATSTGGVRAQPPGRVGDSPLIGAGTWADSGVAISCTGNGEAFIRSGTGRYIGALVEHGWPIAQAAERALGQVRELGATGGLIALDAAGTVAMPFLSAVMPRGVWRLGQEPAVWVG